MNLLGWVMIDYVRALEGKNCQTLFWGRFFPPLWFWTESPTVLLDVYRDGLHESKSVTRSTKQQEVVAWGQEVG